MKCNESTPKIKRPLVLLQVVRDSTVGWYACGRASAVTELQRRWEAMGRAGESTE